MRQVPSIRLLFPFCPDAGSCDARTRMTVNATPEIAFKNMFFMIVSFSESSALSLLLSGLHLEVAFAASSTNAQADRKGDKASKSISKFTCGISPIRTPRTLTWLNQPHILCGAALILHNAIHTRRDRDASRLDKP